MKLFLKQLSNNYRKKFLADYWIIFPSQIFDRLIQECMVHMIERFFEEKSSNNYWLWEWLCRFSSDFISFTWSTKFHGGLLYLESSVSYFAPDSLDDLVVAFPLRALLGLNSFFLTIFPLPKLWTVSTTTSFLLQNQCPTFVKKS